MHGQVVCYRTRLVPKIFSQIPFVDYAELYAPVGRYATLHFLFALKSQRGYNILQHAIKKLLLNGKISEEIYLEVRSDVSLDQNKETISVI